MKEADFKRLLDATAAETREHMDATAADLRKDMATMRVEMRAEMREDMAATTAEMRNHFDATAAEMRNHFDTTAADMRRHNDVRTERLEDKIQLVVETVALLDAKVDRIEASLRDEMRRGFADTNDLLRLSYSSLDRRVTALERGH